MSAVKEHLEQVNDPLLSSEELTYDMQSARARTEGANEVLALYPPLVPPAAAAAAAGPQRQATPRVAPRPLSPLAQRRQTPARRQEAPVDKPRSSEEDVEFEVLDDDDFERWEAYQELTEQLISRAENDGVDLFDILDVITPAEITRLNALNPHWRDDLWEHINAVAGDREYELERQAAGGMRGLGASGGSQTLKRARARQARAGEIQKKPLSAEGDKAAAYLWTSHSELLRTAWVRAGAAEVLIGRTITPMRTADVPFDVREHEPDDVLLVLDKKVESPQAYAAMANPIQQVSLLTWTSKMDCPSYSLPAGPLGAGFNGSCPGATAGQSIVPETRRKVGQAEAIYQIHQKNRARVETQVGKKLEDDKWAQLANVNLADCVCQSCYAEKNKYSYTSNQLAALIRQAWTEAAVEDGSFVTVMDFAIKNTDYYLEGGTRKDQDLSPEPAIDAETGEPAKFFRIHDSGDWFSERYYQAWCEVARLNPDVTFWAPTRVWALNNDWVNGSPPPYNLVVRPSSYMFNRPAALLRSLVRGAGRGYSAPSVSFAVDKANPLENFIPSGYPYHWQCQAYAGTEKHSCRGAMSPPTSENPEGTVGCRACWVFPNLSINYKKH
jgi:hypothetical protein